MTKQLTIQCSPHAWTGDLRRHPRRVQLAVVTQGIAGRKLFEASLRRRLAEREPHAAIAVQWNDSVKVPRLLVDGDVVTHPEVLVIFLTLAAAAQDEAREAVLRELHTRARR